MPATRGSRSGTWLAIIMVVAGIAVALIAHKFRVFTPRPTTQPATMRLS